MHGTLETTNLTVALLYLGPGPVFHYKAQSTLGCEMVLRGTLEKVPVYMRSNLLVGPAGPEE